MVEIWRYNDFQSGVRPPSWIYDVIILHPGTVFKVPNIVLNFQVDRFSTFGYNWTFMFQHFGLKLPIVICDICVFDHLKNCHIYCYWLNAQ